MALSCEQLKKSNLPLYIKVIYNKIIDGKQIDDINSNYTDILKLNVDEIRDSHFENLNSLYCKPPNVESIKYIFLGKYNDEIKVELDKISNKESDIDYTKLYRYFNYKDIGSLKKDWNISETDSIIFVPFYIPLDETIEWLYKILGIYLNTKDDIFKKEYLYMYRYYDDINEINKIINNIEKDYLQKEEKYNFDILKKQLQQ